MTRFYICLRSAGYTRWNALVWAVRICCIHARANRFLKLGARTRRDG